MSTVVPIGRNVTLALGRASAICLDDELGDVAFALAVELGDDVEDVAGPELDDDDEPAAWVAAPVVELELDDPPHAVSSKASEASPVATIHLFLRITSLS